MIFNWKFCFSNGWRNLHVCQIPFSLLSHYFFFDYPSIVYRNNVISRRIFVQFPHGWVRSHRLCWSYWSVIWWEWVCLRRRVWERRVSGIKIWFWSPLWHFWTEHIESFGTTISDHLFLWRNLRPRKNWSNLMRDSRKAFCLSGKL